MPNKSRDLQFTTQQLVGVFLSILALGVFIFLLGISVGKKSAVLAGSASRPAVQSQRADIRPGVIPRRPSGDIQKELDAHAKTSDVPAETKVNPKPGLEAVKTEAKPAEVKTATGKPKSEPAAAKTPEAKPVTKTADAKAVAAAPKTEPAAKKTEAKPTSKTTAEKPAAKPAAKTTEKAAPKTETAKVPAVSAGVWYIQIAATDTKEGARTVARGMEKDGWPMVVLDPLPQDKKPFYRIRVGPYATAAEANAAKAKLAAATGKTDYWVVKT